MTLKGLPSTYNKDLQEDKEPLFDAVDNISACLKIAEGVVATMNVSTKTDMSYIDSSFTCRQVHGEKMLQALTMDVLATDLADYLVRKGVSSIASSPVASNPDAFQIPFRETHHISGRAVALAESRKCQLNDLTLQDFKNLNEKFTDDVRDVFDFEASVERRSAIGGPSRKMIQRQISTLRAALVG